MMRQPSTTSPPYAVTITTAQGIEVMMHIGLDTVQLRGEGFSPKVAEGQAVSAGDTLIGFDADFLATNAKSLLTQIGNNNNSAPFKAIARDGSGN